MSILEWPVLALHFLFESVNQYHGGSTREPGTYEHVWGGFIYSILCILFAKFSLWVLIGIPVFFFYHVIVIEVILDRHKNKAKPEQFRTRDFNAQIIERSAGFIMALPFIWIPFI